MQGLSFTLHLQLSSCLLFLHLLHPPFPKPELTNSLEGCGLTLLVSLLDFLAAITYTLQLPIFLRRLFFIGFGFSCNYVFIILVHVFIIYFLLNLCRAEQANKQMAKCATIRTNKQIVPVVERRGTPSFGVSYPTDFLFFYCAMAGCSMIRCSVACSASLRPRDL